MSARYRAIEVVRASWGAALLIGPDRVLHVTASGPVDTPGRAVTRILGARHLVQAALSGLRPGSGVLAWGVGVDAVHAVTALLLAAVDRRRARAGCTDAAIAAGWAALGWRDLRRDRQRPSTPLPGRPTSTAADGAG
ncbi:hypothetical protein MJO55_27140 [Mycolicibacterium rufum]|uniref:Uncharacterized protein n=1 Tax=Mycolicibacterium rufum TaxID=318424 RepID=A0A9X2YCV1_9MYCO|nr:hypothetical protein [Mycolicibacterium rufum]MCV7071669.1 hypothetical protein [Mycolicibacterium rufum]ULP36792.1 hypothetical protein MJO55_27140 [Mycolicibacterium rufum]